MGFLLQKQQKNNGECCIIGAKVNVISFVLRIEELSAMIRRIIQIDEEKCNGCGACAEACHEGAIAMVEGKAKLMRDDYCDGLGDCLPACPVEAISFVEREAAAYDEAAVKRAQMAKTKPHHGCPGTLARRIKEQSPESDVSANSHAPSRLSSWPVQIRLAPVNAPYFDGAELLIAADCTAYAFGAFHERFMKGKVTLIGCPKLDDMDYAEKLTSIIRDNDIKSVTIARMEVPCCGGLERQVTEALKNSGKFIPWRVVVISTDGRIVKE